MSEEKKESGAETKPEENSTSEKSIVEETKSPEEIKAEEAAAKATEEDAAKKAKAEAASGATAKAEAAARAAEEAEAAAKEALAKAEAAKAEAEAAAEAEYKAIADEVKAEAVKKSNYTFKRSGEEIFRREMSEPEFFLDKKDRFPRPILSADEQASLTRKAEMPKDQTPQYAPEHVLSPEFSGVSNYERGVDSFLDEVEQKLETLKNDPEATEKQIEDAKNEIIYLKSLYENFYIGMNVFRTAKGGRDKIKS
ncbi:MAG: hypothetical protein ACRBB2_08690 [Nitrosopumilus sp.]